jgi:hypothetical protein
MGPEPGGPLATNLVSEAVVASATLALPAEVYLYYGPTPATPVVVAPPAFGTATFPASIASLVGADTQVSSLVGLAPSVSLVDAVWGMDFIAQAGEGPAGYIAGSVQPQLAFASEEEKVTATKSG